MNAEQNYNPQHLAGQFFNKAAEKGEAALFYDKIEGHWQMTSYASAAEKVRQLASGLQTLGLQSGDRVILCAPNSAQWAICDLAIMAAGGIVVPAYTTHTSRDHDHQLRDSGACFILCADQKILQTLLEVGQHHEQLKAVIVLEGTDIPTLENKPDHYPFQLLSFKDVLERAEKDTDFTQRLDKGGRETCCIIYTSGTGGQPKGVMLSHHSIQANIDAAKELLEEGQALENAVFLSLLPLSHAYEHTAGLHLPIQIGAEVYYCEGSDKIAANLAEVRPTLMTAVPRLYEVLHERIIRGVEAKGGLSAKAFYKALALGNQKWKGERLSFKARLLDRLLDKVVRKKVKNRLGGRLKFFVSGGAALNPEIGRFFLGLGVNILQGYGQTEASPLISANRPGAIRIETVGPAVRGVEVKLSKEGELLARGDCIMNGYWQNSKATQDTLRNGWLYTGDLAEISQDGFITITGRKKDMIVNSGGDNIAPSRIEAEFLMQPEIAQIMVAGDDRPWLAAIIVPSQTLEGLSPAEIEQQVKGAVARANAKLAGFERLRKFIIASEAFSIENNQMTPTLKVRRHAVLTAYQDKLDQLYK